MESLRPRGPIHPNRPSAMRKSEWTLRAALEDLVWANVPRARGPYRSEFRLIDLVGRRARQLQRAGYNRSAAVEQILAELAGADRAPARTAQPPRSLGQIVRSIAAALRR